MPSRSFSLNPTPSAATPVLAGIAGAALFFGVVGVVAFLSHTYPFHQEENQAARLPKTPFREFVNDEYVGIPGRDVPNDYTSYLIRKRVD